MICRSGRVSAHRHDPKARISATLHCTPLPEEPVFFRDCQEWDWIGRRFDPNRALAVPRSVAALIGTNPRVIADEVWAKLLWAGLNLDPADLPGNYTYYPMELIRAVTLTWLFSGLRSDEIT